MEEQPKAIQKLSWPKMFLSVCSAFLGVQSDKNLASDFSSGRIWPYLIIGLVVVTIFILSLIVVVKLILYLTL